VLPEDVLHCCGITNIRFDKNGLTATDLPDPPDNRGIAIAEVVQNDDIMAGVQQRNTGMRTDKACPAGE
jgi:hypothetical protein